MAIKKKVKSTFTNTAGQKVTTYVGGGKSVAPAGAPKESVADTVTTAKAMLEQTKAEGSKPFKGSTYEKMTEPTVVTDSNVREKYIPELNSKINKLTEKGAYYDAAGNKRNADGTIIEEDTTQNTEVFNLEKSASQDQKEISKVLKSLQSQTDADTARQISAIQAQSNVREQQIMEANRRAERATAQSLLQGGSSRYTTSSNDIMAAEVRSGIMELADLDAREQVAIAEIQSAQAEKNYKLASAKVEMLETQRKEKLDKAAKLAETLATQNEELRKQAKREEQEIAIAEQIQSGFTNPMDIFAALKGKVPFDDILKITKDLGLDKAQESFTLGSMDIRYDAQGNVIARGAKVGGGGGGVGNGTYSGMPVTTVGKPTVEGLGNTYESSSDEAQMVIDDILNKIPVQLRNTEKETELKKEQIRKQLAAGYKYQQIVDRLSGFSLQGNVNKGLGNALYNYALGTDVDLGSLASQINRGADEQAMTTVENAQLKNVGGFFTNTEKARSTIKQADLVLSLLEDPTFPKEALGAYDGRVFKVNRFFGLNDTERAKVQKLESALQLLAAPIRVEVAGTAATEGEMAKISAFQSDILDQPDTIKTQVEALRNSVLGFHNEARSQRGLPVIDKTELIDNKARLQKYKQIGSEYATPSTSTMTNQDLFNDILGIPTDTAPKDDAAFWKQMNDWNLSSLPGFTK